MDLYGQARYYSFSSIRKILRQGLKCRFYLQKMPQRWDCFHRVDVCNESSAMFGYTTLTKILPQLVL